MADLGLPTDACLRVLRAAVPHLRVVEAVGHNRGIHAPAEIPQGRHAALRLPPLRCSRAEKGLTWTRSLVGADEYAGYWTGRTDGLGAFRREDWESELEELIRAGIFNPADRAQCDRDFTDTGRRTAVPRPGFLLAWQWPLEDARAAHFPGEVRMALRLALIALGESNVSFGIRAATTPP
jgi:hypothetical protein